MSFDVDVVEKEIAARLDPLRLALEANNILVAALPKESGAFSSSVREGIDFVISKAVGVASSANSFLGFQDILYTLTVVIALRKRYQDDLEEHDVLNWVCSKVFKLLFNYQSSIGKTAFSFVDYTPMQPENGLWSVQMQFSFLGAASEPPIANSYDALAVEFVQLFGKREDGTTSLISQTPQT